MHTEKGGYVMSYRKHYATKKKMIGVVLDGKKPIKNGKTPHQTLSAQEILEAMTKDEKIDYISGIESFCVRPIDRLGLPGVWMADATSGVRGWDIDGAVMPSGVAMAASFDRDLIAKCAKDVAEECRGVGVSVLLGPGVNMARIPVCGRNFEYMGEDPFLAGEMAASYVRGAQEGGVVTTVKHFACNNSDYNRHKENAVVDERTLREIYLPAFEKAVREGGSLGVMTSYNQVNGTYASENAHLLDDILRGEWDYSGFVVSDWTSLYDTVGPVKHGVDIEMPGAQWFTRSRIKKALASGMITMDDIDRKVLRLLKVWERMGILSRPVAENSGCIGSRKHRTDALHMAQESITLLKNDTGMLPLSKRRLKKLVILGYNAVDMPISGGGAAFVTKKEPIKNLEKAFKERIPDLQVTSLGWHWQDRKGNHKLVKEADAVIYATGYDRVFECEMFDRPYELLEGEAEGIRLAASLNPNTIVVIHSGGDCETSSWIDSVNSLIFAYYLGGEGADALADVILGKINPSGHLPFTIAKKADDYSTMRNLPDDYWIPDNRRRGYPGQGNPKVGQITDVVYDEGIHIGYRWFDTNNLDVEFPFGHGLSYTSFSYSDLNLQREGAYVKVHFTVMNTGRKSGTAVPQVYVHDSTPCIEKSEQALCAFERVTLSPGESAEVSITVDPRAFSHFDTGSGSWKFDPGQYEIRVGASSRDIRMKACIEV